MQFTDHVRRHKFYEIDVAEYMMPKVKIPRKCRNTRYFVVTSRFEKRNGKYDIHIYRTPYLDENSAGAIYSFIAKDWSRTGPRTWNSVRKMYVDNGGYVKDVS